MTVHFAAARTSAASPVARALTRVELGCPANDNGEIRPHDAVLRASLRHFAEHGLGAARDARERAHTAFFAGDRETYDMWLGVCHTLDRRLAQELDRSVSAKNLAE
ncbi:hypothetical protein [Altererythrobacter sp. ZODW24]|uniref:hypothetical protein n=1 Tax=Altererythrobacter sp. ZODW24 TaxID=2185142 RepID=UPI000DF7C605|nr:hypothetical protein [Altererythrobacter sp. ZODW24]